MPWASGVRGGIVIRVFVVTIVAVVAMALVTVVAIVGMGRSVLLMLGLYSTAA